MGKILVSRHAAHAHSDNDGDQIGTHGPGHDAGKVLVASWIYRIDNYILNVGRWTADTTNTVVVEQRCARGQ